MSDKRITIILSQAQYNRVKKLAKRTHRSFSGQIRAIIDSYFQKKEAGIE